MRINLEMGGNAELDSLADEVAREVWTSLCSVPELKELYAGYFVSVRSITFEFLSDHATGRPEHVELSFEDPEAVEAFETDLAGRIAIGLDRVMNRIPALPLISQEIPHAIHGALAPHLERPGRA